MTAQTRATNQARFEQGDAPQGSDFVDLIDSFVAIADTTAQSITSTLTVGGLTTSGEVSAATGNITSIQSTDIGSVLVSAGTLRAPNIIASTSARFVGTIEVPASAAFSGTTTFAGATTFSGAVTLTGVTTAAGVVQFNALPVLISGAPVSALANVTAQQPFVLQTITSAGGNVRCRGLVKFTVEGTTVFIPFWYGGQ